MATEEKGNQLVFLTAPLDALEAANPHSRRRHHFHFRHRHDSSESNPKTDEITGEASSSENDGGPEEVHASDLKSHSERKESSNIELFYDLFVVANVTLFSRAHTISDPTTLGTYISFFSLIWFTWLNLAFFSVRFSADCFMDRLFMGLQLGGMVGFAVLSPEFKPDSIHIPWPTLRSMSLILMATRVVLALQYISVIFLARKRPAIRTPLLIITASTLIAAIIYGTLTIAFEEEKFYHSYMAWYIVAGVEIIVNVFVTSEWKSISFKGTHLVERMSLLTLIILGEGVITLFDHLDILNQVIHAYSPATVGNIFSIVMIYYCLYMLYFHKIQNKDFGLIREQVWTYFHFGLHVALILVVSGVNQFFIVVKIVEQYNHYDGIINDIQLSTGNLTTAADIRLYGQTLLSLYQNFTNEFGKVASISPNQTGSAMNAIDGLTRFNDTVIPEVVNTVINDNTVVVEAYFVEVLASAYKFTEFEEKKDLLSQYNAFFSRFNTVYSYVYCCAGLSLLFIALLSYIRYSHQAKVSLRLWISIATHIVFGMTLSLLTLTVLDAEGEDSTANFVYSPWCLPIIAIFYFICVVVDILCAYRWSGMRGNLRLGKRKFGS